MIKRFPHEYQLDGMDCGPACLKIIAKYYGKYFKLAYLRELCGIRREGVSFYDLGEASEKLGFRSRCYSVNWDQLCNKVPFPCILHWKGSHFVVAYKYSNKKIYISDPSSGYVSYSKKELCENWIAKESSGDKGHIVVLEPTSAFYNNENEAPESSKNLFRILSYFKPYKKNIACLLLVMLVVTCLQAVLPFISKAVIDVGIQTNDLDFINIILLANITIVFSMLLGNTVRDWILLHITSRVSIALISDFLIKLMKLPISFFETKHVGDILQRASDHERIRTFITSNALGLIFASLTFAVFAGVLLIFNPIIFWIFLLGNAIYSAWVLTSIKWRKKLDWESFSLTSKNQSYWVETVSNMQDIKTNNHEIQRRWEWEAIQTKLFKVNQRVLTLNNIQTTGAQFISNVTNLTITFYCAKAVINGVITFGVMISTQFVIGMLNGPVAQFIQYITSYQYAKISYERLTEIHELKDEQDHDKANSLNLPKFKTLLVKNVSFKYGANSPFALRGLSFVIPEKRVTAIVGDSGSGKSTILKLLLRLYEPTLGEIQMGNMNVKSIDIKHWRERCAAVLQDGKIFNDTILGNIVLGDSNIDYERLRDAVDAANIRREIEELPLGYKTVLGEQGQGMSGGQKQRLLIARALYRNPDFLFLDEATNSLDSVNEEKIVTALDTIFKEKTVVVVAHRLSTIRKADQIIVMRMGAIVEIGNHDDLINMRGYYCKLIDSQMQSTLNA